MEFRIRNNSCGWYIAVLDKSAEYLFKRGEVIQWFSEFKDRGYPYCKQQTYFVTKTEAEEFLTNYERDQNMSERLTQVEKDIKLLEVERDKIKAEETKASETFRVGQYFKLGRQIVRLVQVGHMEYSIITEYGNRYSSPVKVKDHNITRSELQIMWGSFNSCTPIKIEIKEVD